MCSWRVPALPNADAHGGSPEQGSLIAYEVRSQCLAARARASVPPGPSAQDYARSARQARRPRAHSVATAALDQARCGAQWKVARRGGDGTSPSGIPRLGMQRLPGRRGPPDNPPEQRLEIASSQPHALDPSHLQAYRTASPSEQRQDRPIARAHLLCGRGGPRGIPKTQIRRQTRAEQSFRSWVSFGPWIT